jgi:hypothetical protein
MLVFFRKQVGHSHKFFRFYKFENEYNIKSFINYNLIIFLRYVIWIILENFIAQMNMSMNAHWPVQNWSDSLT